MYKLVVSEFDNVLINSEEAISVSTILKIDEIRNSGVLFCVYTDRCLKEILNYNQDFPFIDYIIFAGGSALYDVGNSKIIISKYITSFVLKKIISTLSNYKIYGVSFDKRFLIKNIDSKVYKLEIVCTNKKDLEIINEKLKQLDLNISFCFKKEKNGYVVEIIMNSINECSLIEKICSLEKIGFNEVIVIDNCEQDISSFKFKVINITSSIHSNVVEVLNHLV